jgi:DNA-binding NarL/FixJ family response regulator
MSSETLRIPIVWRLTPGEQDVLIKLCEGMTNKEIAQALGVSCGTVKRRVSELLGKLKCSNRIQVALKVMKDNEFQRG